MAHDTEVKAVLRAYKKALDTLQRLDRARRDFRRSLLNAHEAGANKAELARFLLRENVSRADGRRALSRPSARAAERRRRAEAP